MKEVIQMQEQKGYLRKSVKLKYLLRKKCKSLSHIFLNYRCQTRTKPGKIGVKQGRNWVETRTNPGLTREASGTKLGLSRDNLYKTKPGLN